MDEIGPAPALNGFQRYTQVLQPPLVEIVQVSVRTSAVQLGWSRIDHETQTFFSPLQVFDVMARSVPMHNGSPLVEEGCLTDAKPAVLHVETAYSCFTLEGLF